MKKNWIYFVIVCFFVIVTTYYILSNKDIIDLSKLEDVTNLFQEYFQEFLSMGHPISLFGLLLFASFIIYAFIKPEITQEYFKTDQDFEKWFFICVGLIVFIFILGF